MPLRFKCRMCSSCCVFEDPRDMPVVFSFERERLERLASARGIRLSFTPLEVVATPEESVVVLYRWVVKGRCPFNDPETYTCTIHEHKPLSCRMYPLLLGLTDNTVRVSAACSWVRDHMPRVLSENPVDVFPEETRALLEAYTAHARIIEGLKARYGDVRVVVVEDAYGYQEMRRVKP